MQLPYSTKSTAQRAAAKSLGVPNKAAEVAKYVNLVEKDGKWYIESKKTKSTPKKKASKANGKATFKRPGEGTVTGRVWELADELKTRAKVMEAGLAEGIAAGTISQQYHRWNHQA